MMHQRLPNDDERKAIGELLHAAFIELRYINDQPIQVHDLAYAFHNLPVEIYGWGTWDVHQLHRTLKAYRCKYPDGGPDYAAMLAKIFPDELPKMN